MNIIEPDDEQLGRDAGSIVEAAKRHEIVSGESFQKAGDLLKGIVYLLQEVDKTFDESIASAYKAHRDIIKAKKKHATPLAQARDFLRGRIGQYEDDQEQARLQKERELQQKAQKREEQIALEEAAVLEAEGHSEEAQKMIEEPIEAPVVVVKKTVPKVDGISTKHVWKFRIVDADVIPKDYLMPDEKAIGAIVRARKGKVDIPGVKVYKEAVVSTRL